MEQYVINNRRYMGCKQKLLLELQDVLQKYTTGNSFLDLFGGTGSVTAYFYPKYEKCIINDILYANELSYLAFFQSKDFEQDKVDYYTEVFNNLNADEIEDNYFSINYGYDRFFYKDDALIIGEIRQRIEDAYTQKEITKSTYNVLLCSLMFSTDKVAQTCGIYDSYSKTKRNFKHFVFNCIKPYDCDNVAVYRKDANEIVKEVVTDIVYLDPPYNSRDYGRYYHVLEQLIKWDNAELNDNAARHPKNINEIKSKYCTKREAFDTFKHMIEDIQSKYIVVSYNNHPKNCMTYDEIISTLEAKGKLTIVSKDYKAYNAGKTDATISKENTEYFFVVETK